jgi:hypothetical protein
MSNLLRKAILIVCEGTKSEPDYFKALRDIVIRNDKDIFITIDPIPPQQKIDEEEALAFQLRQGAKRRQLKDVTIPHPEFEVEPQYRAQPTSYVRKAQLGLESGIYNESWAVYDKDGHAAHQQALQLSYNLIDNKKVQIALNSIAFEYWILLHFERSTTPFTKSMCRRRLPNDKKQELFCGSNTDHQDCQGVNCVAGRIVSQQYLQYKEKHKSFEFENFHPNVATAITHAVALRNSYIGNVTPIYDLNPYTTTDRLVFRMMHLGRIDFNWFVLDETQNCEPFIFNLSYSNSTIHVNVENISTSTQICSQENVVLVNAEGEIQPCGTRTMLPPFENNTASFSISLNQFAAFQPLFIGLKVTEGVYLISEIPI